MKSKWNYLLIVMAMILVSVLPSASAFGADIQTAETETVSEDDIETGPCGDQATYQLNKTSGVLTISGTGEMNDRISGGDPLFWNKSTIHEVIIEEGITSIPVFAFRSCVNLRSITIPDSLSKIHNGAFYLCDNLTEVHISSLESWMNIDMNGAYPFGSSKGGHLFLNGEELTDLRIPEGAAKVDNFIYCNYLTSLVIPDGVTEIAQSAFAFCENLASVSIPDSVTKIGSGAFDACTNLVRISIPENVNRIDFFYGCSRLKYVNIPAAVIKVGYQSFTECTSLSAIVIPEGVISIGEEAFAGCSSLREVWLPKSLETIEAGAFDTTYPVKVYYAGSQSEWNAVTIEDKNHLESPIICNRPAFNDVTDTGKYYFRPVYWAVDQGITKGYSDGSFGTDKNCTREETITFLWRQAGKPSGKLKKVPFSDVDRNAYYYKAVLWAYEKGITKGYSTGEHAGKFGVGLPVTREDTVTFLYRMAGKPAVSEADLSNYYFPDEISGSYYCKPIAWAAKNKITKGYSSGDYAGMFGVGLNVLRQDIITFLYRYAD